MMVTGHGSPMVARSGSLTTPLVRLKDGDPVTYALEGSAAIAGGALTWLVENFGVLHSPGEAEVK